MEDRDRRILELEERHPERGDAKHEVVRVELGLNAVRYYQRLNELVVLPDVGAGIYIAPRACTCPCWSGNVSHVNRRNAEAITVTCVSSAIAAAGESLASVSKATDLPISELTGASALTVSSLGKVGGFLRLRPSELLGEIA